MQATPAAKSDQPLADDGAALVELPSSSAAAPLLQRSRGMFVAATTIGNALEFYDFIVYSFFAIIIGKLFFPTLSGYLQLLTSVAAFGIGFVMRPLGGIVLGAYADRAGRKAALTLTILLMALGCAMIGLAPTYAQIGIWAPTLIVLARLVQGFSAGGEVGAATTMLVEHASDGRRGLFGSMQFASQGMGVVIGALVAAALSYALPQSALESWGWRVPFLLGVCIAPVGFYIRNRLEETLPPPRPSGAAAPGRLAAAPSRLRVLLRDHWKIACLGTLLTIGSTVCSQIVTFYMPTYAIRELKLPGSIGLTVALVSGVITVVCALLGGALSDVFGRKSVILASRFALVVLIYPGFVWLASAPSFGRLLTTVGVLSVFVATSTAPCITMLPEMFPTRIRATGMSVVYSIGVAIFGGFAQLTATWLISATGDKLAPAYYMIVCACVSTLALFGIRDRAGHAMAQS